MNWQRLCAWMLLLSMVAGLAGCGSPEGARNPKDNTTDITSEETP
jgi:hypothetical protein